MLSGLNNKRFVSHLESYTVSTSVSIKACENNLKMPLREARVVLHNKACSSNKVWKDVRARVCRFKNVKPIQATIFKAIKDVSCCTDKCIQALEALYFFERKNQISKKRYRSSNRLFCGVLLLVTWVSNDFAIRCARVTQLRAGLVLWKSTCGKLAIGNLSKGS